MKSRLLDPQVHKWKTCLEGTIVLSHIEGSYKRMDINEREYHYYREGQEGCH